MPSKVLRNCKDSWAPFLKDFSVILSGVLSETLKQADIIPIFKKKDSFKKKNYRSVSSLTVVSKMNYYIEEFLSPYLCGYRKDFSTHQALISHIKKWKTNLEKKGYRGAIFMNLSKAFYTINHEFF